MDKLTTERLEKFVSNIKTDGMCDITDYQVALALRQLLAYEQAAKNAIGSFHISGGQVEATTDYCFDGEWPVQDGEVLVYAAPVLPKQPELVENLKKVMNNWLAMEPKLAFQPEFTDVMMLLDAEPAPAQPVIPEGLINAINRLLDNDGSRGCFDALEQHRAKTELERLLAAAQQNEPQNIPENIPAQLVSEPYKLPVRYFSYGSECGFDWHNTEKEAIESAEAAIDDYRGDACDGWSEETDSVCWGVILQRATKVDEHQRTDDDYHIAPYIDTVCDYALLPELVGNSPVIPDGWKLVPIEPTEEMIVRGFESRPDELFSEPEVWEEYAAMSGCKQAAHKAKLCWTAMLASAPAQEIE